VSVKPTILIYLRNGKRIVPETEEGEIDAEVGAQSWVELFAKSKDARVWFKCENGSYSVFPMSEVTLVEIYPEGWSPDA
jgi:hypothetical protein